jgi:hypothetical protein
MTEPSVPRPVPPGRPAPRPAAPAGSPAPQDGDRYANLDGRPVAEHVEVFEAEHDRLQAELGTIDRI